MSIEYVFIRTKDKSSVVNLVKFKEEIQLKMTSVIAISPKEGSADDVK